MVTGKTLGAVVGGLGLVLASALVSRAVSAPRALQLPTVHGEAAPWARHLATVDSALEQGDVPAALQAWQQAYSEALRSRRWEGYADVSDAYLRIGRIADVPGSAVPRARELYLTALFRARDAGSLDGVLRVAVAFAALGDHEVTSEVLRMARQLAPRPDPAPRARLTKLEGGLSGR